MTDAAYLRFPHVRADLLTFVAEDDVWLAPRQGGRAWRISADRVPVTNPRISPDGTHIAWTSTRDGAPEVHLAATDGGPPRRLTHWGNARTRVLGWLSDREVLALTAHGEPSTRRSWAHAVPTDGGPGRRLPFGPTGGLAFGPDGGTLLVSAPMGREAAWWKRYRGGTAGKLWIDRVGDGDFVRIHQDLDSNIESPMWLGTDSGDRIAFLSDHEGVAQLYSSRVDGSDLTAHSHGEFYARNASSDGSAVVYHSAGDLHLLNSPDAGEETSRVELSLAGPRTARAPYPLDASAWLGEISPDATGRGSAVEVRGTVHWLTHRDGPVRALAEEPGVRARLPRLLGDTGQVAWVTDADGEDALDVADLAPTASTDTSTVATSGGQSRRIGAGRFGRVLELAASPDGSWLAAAAHDGRLLLVDVASGEITELDRSADGDVSGLTFSPDSGWLAWSFPGPEPLRQIKLADLSRHTVLEATPLRFNDYDPAFTTDGQYLAFLSVRSFDPVYDAHVFDLSFPGGCRPQLLPLAVDTPSPFDPRPGGRGFDTGSSAASGSGTGNTAGDGAGDGADAATMPGEPPRTVVHGENLAQRVVPFPVDSGQYRQLRTGSGGVLWLKDEISGVLGSSLATPGAEPPRPVLQRYDLTQRRCETLVDGLSDYEVSGDGSRFVLVDGNRVAIRPSDRRITGNGEAAGDDDVTVDLNRLRVTVDPAAEWAQEYAENGRIMRDMFWRADMGGLDWDAVLDRYRPLLERINSHDEFVDLLWEVHGELGTSHAYVVPKPQPTPARLRQGLLGADLERDEDGRWRIARVLPGEPSEPLARSPLTAPGVLVRESDVLLAVDGREVDSETGPGPLLVGTAGTPVELTVRSADDTAPRRVVVVPLADEEPLRYQDWVAGRRALVHERTDGRLGYLHVPDMIASGWAQLHRDLRTETAREGLVVDVRENRGGHTSELVVEKLARQVLAWTTARDARPETYPTNAPRGPVVVLCNFFSGSDGDIVNAAAKSLGLGPVVGERTWGGVIGIDQRYSLVDGTGVTQPKYAFWFRDWGWSVENYGVDPDVEVVMAPQDWAAGRDPQLDSGMELALARLRERPAAVPPELPAPNRGARIVE